MLGIMLKMNNVLNKNTVLERDVQKTLTQESLQQESLQQDQCEMRTRAVDARIVKSRQSLRDALINLIEEKGFDALTVGDLCSAASLNRGTFYNHFRDKEDLLATFEEEIMQDLGRYQVQMSQISLPVITGYVLTKKPLPFLVDLFEYLREQGDFLHALLGPGGDAGFATRIKESICTNLVHQILHEQYRNSQDPLVDYYVAFFASAYLGVITRWIQKGMPESSEDMALIAVRLLFIKPGESIKM